MDIPSLSPTVPRSDAVQMTPLHNPKPVEKVAVTQDLLRNNINVRAERTNAFQAPFAEIRRQLEMSGPITVSMALRSTNTALAQRADAAEPSRAPMYDARGSLNSQAMNEVLNGIKNALRKLDLCENKAIQLIDKTLEGETMKSNKALYGALKDISRAIERSSSHNDNRRLGAAVMQMARAHNYQTGMIEYDEVGRAATATQFRKNSTIEKRSNAFTQTTLSLGVKGGPKLGASAGVADAASLSASLGVNATKTNMLFHDYDTDFLFIKKGQVAVSLSSVGKVGSLAKTLQAATLSGSIEAKGLRGFMVEGQKANDVLSYSVMHAREGGDSLSPKLAPSKYDLKSLANTATLGITSTLTGLTRRVKGWLSDGQVVDRQIALNTHKIIKGGTPSLFLVRDNSLLKGIRGCEDLQKYWIGRMEPYFRWSFPQALNQLWGMPLGWKPKARPRLTPAFSKLSSAMQKF
ncbi:hypothetical protein [Pseudomonas zeae]|uniref:hypothetical protein n=1 Tax=Pseudomonas zeae TaxID=2745510 RepID=UPI0039E19A5C